jgi:hypothetical protein
MFEDSGCCNDWEKSVLGSPIAAAKGPNERGCRPVERFLLHKTRSRTFLVARDRIGPI